MYIGVNVILTKIFDADNIHWSGLDALAIRYQSYLIIRAIIDTIMQR